MSRSRGIPRQQRKPLPVSPDRHRHGTSSGVQSKRRQVHLQHQHLATISRSRELGEYDASVSSGKMDNMATGMGFPAPFQPAKSLFGEGSTLKVVDKS